MLRNKPSFSYNGLTVILSNPSRFDKVNLLESTGGRLFNDLLRPEFNKLQCDIRLKEDHSSLLPNTKCIICLGEAAAKEWIGTDNHIGEIRGSWFCYSGIPITSSFFPQDAADVINYEKVHNPNYISTEEDESDYDEGSEKRRHGKTKRKNYRFWLSKDLEKCKYVLQHNEIPKRTIEPNYILYPDSETLLKALSNRTGETLFIDLETFVPSCDIKCVGFSFGRSPDIYVFPFYSYTNTWAYSDLPFVFRALAKALACNTIVAHNGHGFDFPVLAWKYKIPLSRSSQDTMIMQHCIYSDIEKSLGHLTSLWTNEPFHKDEGDTGYFTNKQMHDTMSYCGKDIFTMKLAYYSMLEYAATIPGLTESINIGNAAIYPYLVTTLTGLSYSEEMRVKLLTENDRYMMQLLRMLEILIGKDTLEKIAGPKSKSSMPSSNKQCIEYFHNLLQYDVVMKGKEKADGSRAPSLGKNALHKLRLKYDNAAIDVVLAYREYQKESSILNFTPWTV